MSFFRKFFSGKPDSKKTEPGQTLSEDHQVQQFPLKDRVRADEKVREFEADGRDASYLTDILAFKIVHTTLEKAYQALDYTRQKYNVAYFTDRFVNPTPSGFRDMMLSLRMSNGHVSEMRLALESFEAIAKQVETQTKDFRESILDQVKDQGKEFLNQEEALRLSSFVKTFQMLYGQAWFVETGRDRMPEHVEIRALIGHYLVNDRPVKIERSSDGLTAVVYDVRTGIFLNELKYLLKIAFGTGDITEISEVEYSQQMSKRIAKHQELIDEPMQLKHN